MVDATHDARRRSFVESADEHPDFPIQNLPLGVFWKARKVATIHPKFNIHPENPG